MNYRHFQNINKNIQRMTMLAFTRSSARMTQEQNIEREAQDRVNHYQIPQGHFMSCGRSIPRVLVEP